jgi:hypothetical protein
VWLISSNSKKENEETWNVSKMKMTKKKQWRSAKKYENRKYESVAKKTRKWKPSKKAGSESENISVKCIWKAINSNDENEES